MQKVLEVAVCLFCAAYMAAAEDVSKVQFNGKTFTIVRVNLDEDQLRLFCKNDTGASFKSFEAIQNWLAMSGKKLAFAMNAGMYHRDYEPVGLYVEEYRQLTPLNLRREEENFFLLPNGVFAVTDVGACVIESSRYTTLKDKVRSATQSGPMLIIDGKIHPAFNPDSTSRLIRNGVGIISPKLVVFAISEEPVSFYEFALLFRDMLHCRNALFLDGTVSSLHSEKLKRSDRKIDLGPIIGIVADKH